MTGAAGGSRDPAGQGAIAQRHLGKEGAATGGLVWGPSSPGALGSRRETPRTRDRLVGSKVLL